MFLGTEGCNLRASKKAACVYTSSCYGIEYGSVWQKNIMNLVVAVQYTGMLVEKPVCFFSDGHHDGRRPDQMKHRPSEGLSGRISTGYDETAKRLQ